MHPTTTAPCPLAALRRNAGRIFFLRREKERGIKDRGETFWGMGTGSSFADSGGSGWKYARKKLLPAAKRGTKL